MGIYSSFEKKAGIFTVEVSQPHPRWVTITQEGSALAGMRVKDEDARDLLYALERALDLAALDDERAQRSLQSR